MPDLSMYGAAQAQQPQPHSAGGGWSLDKPAPPLGHPRTPTEMRKTATELTLGYAPDAQREAREMGYAFSPAYGAPPAYGEPSSPPPRSAAGDAASYMSPSPLGSPHSVQQQAQQAPQAPQTPQTLQKQRHVDALLAQLAARAAPFEPSRIFEDWDTNRDSRISRDEFGRVAVRWLGYAVPVGDLDTLFSALDTDGSNTLSRRELAAALQRHRP